MQYQWQKEGKYYKVSLQANLFGSTDIICSWGSLTYNHTGYKVIPCKNQHDIDLAVQAIAKRRVRQELTMQVARCLAIHGGRPTEIGQHRQISNDSTELSLSRGWF